MRGLMDVEGVSFFSRRNCASKQGVRVQTGKPIFHDQAFGGNVQLLLEEACPSRARRDTQSEDQRAHDREATMTDRRSTR
mmetsp:Transcript_9758/g.29123  ORF Transcript_9758/g.29123 Transcript_9758/m.29123 type:complete len:80 (-) Transcript_9758:38-277(-)